MVCRFSEVGTLAACAFVIACNAYDGTGPGTSNAGAGIVRVANVAASSPAIDVNEDRRRIGSNVTFLSSSPSCFEVAAGRRAFEFLQAGTANRLVTLVADVAADTRYTIVLLGDENPALLPEPFTTAPASQARLRFVHAAPRAGAIDVDVAPVSIGGEIESFEGIDVDEVTPFFLTSNQNVSIRFRTRGTQSVLFTIPDFAFPPAGVATIILAEDAQGAFQFLLVAPCD